MGYPFISLMSEVGKSRYYFREGESIKATVQSYGKKAFQFHKETGVGTNEDAEDILQDVWYQLSKLDRDQLSRVGACYIG